MQSRQSRPGVALVLLLIIVNLAMPSAGVAQVGERPGDRRPDPQLPRDEGPAVGLSLPPIVPSDESGARAGVQIVVADFDFRGNTVWSDEELRRVTAPWLDRPIGAEDLDDIADAVTRFYVETGYVTSSAFIPDQETDEGRLILQVVEGTLGSVDVKGTRWFRDRYIRRRLALSLSEPLNVHTLERRLQLLQQDAHIVRIDALIGPAIGRRESTLTLTIEEASPFDLAVRYSNRQSPSVGADGAEVTLSQRNLLGIGDQFDASGWFTPGFTSIGLGYSLPLNARHTELRLELRHSQSEVIESGFTSLDLENELINYSAALVHPLIWTSDVQLLVGAAYLYRRSKTLWLGGQPFEFAPGSDANGNIKLQILQLMSDWVWRTDRQVVAVRGIASLGLDALDPALLPAEGAPDGKAVSFLAQAQFVRQLSDRLLASQLVLRADLQLASEWLVSMEQFAVGGSRSVRGYRENSLVRDNGWAGSIELRVPVKLPALTRGDLELAPFFDIGESWNHNRGPRRETLASLGVGLRYSWTRHFSAESTLR